MKKFNTCIEFKLCELNNELKINKIKIITGYCFVNH